LPPWAGPPPPALALLRDRSQLRGRLLEVLAYAASALERLDLLAPLWSAERRAGEGRGGGDDALLRRRDKVAAEGLLLAYLAARVPEQDAPLAAAVAAVVDRAERQLATPRSEALLRRFPQTTTTLGLSYVLLGQLGRPHAEIEELLRRQLRRGWAAVSERSPYRLMDARWTFALLDPTLLGPPEALLPFSTLAASPHPLANLSEDDYALTHAVFYLTDFGRRPPPPDLARRAAALLDPFLAWHAVQLDLDLLGEMLIAALAMRMPTTPALAFACETLLRAWDEGGLVGPEYSAARAAELRGAEREAYELDERYHTVFVGGILCAVALCAPPPSRKEWSAGSVADEGEIWRSLAERCRLAAGRLGAGGRQGVEATAVAADDLLERIVARLLQALALSADPSPPWLLAATHSEVGRAGLERVLADALLVATARRYRLVQLAEALAAVAPHAALRTPTFVRTVDFLLDQQLADGRVGIHALLAEEGAAQRASEAQSALGRLLHEVGAALAR
jgi:hypothetical protein